MHRLVRVTSTLLLVAAGASAQLKETVNVHLVEVPVTVTDRDGNPVRGLTAANFEILDEGQKRPIASFDQIDFASRDSLRGSALNPAARRSFLLLFDLSFSSPVSRAKAGQAARNFIARGMQNRDLAAIGSVDVDRGFRLLTAFTTDRRLLTAAINNPVTFRSSDPLQIAGSEVTELPPDNMSGERDVNSIDENTVEIARLEKRLNDSYNRGRVERQITQLGGIARTLRMLPGRKQVVFFSEGFDPRLVQGRDARALKDTLADMDLVLHGEAFKTDSDQRFGNSTTLMILGRMARLFRSSDVMLHAVDIKGVRVQNDLKTGATINSNDALFLVSQPTGGSVFQHSNDINDDMQRMLRAQEVVYVLGFRAPFSEAGKFHELKVKIVGANVGRVQHRAGYYENAGENVLERVLSNAEIVVNDLPQTEINVAVLAVPFPTGKSSQVPVILEISGADLIRDAKTKQIVAEVFIYAFDDEGTVRDRIYQRLSIDGSKADDAFHKNGIKYYATLSLPEGRYSVKSLVRVPQTDRKGYARTDINVPPPRDVAVTPPLFMEEPGRWVMIKGDSHDTSNARYPFEVNGESFIPSASVHVKSGEPRDVAIFVYNSEADEMVWETTTRDALGIPRKTSPSLVKQLQGDDVMKLVFRYDPGEAAGGIGSLDVTVHKKGSTELRKATTSLSIQR